MQTIYAYRPDEIAVYGGPVDAQAMADLILPRVYIFEGYSLDGDTLNVTYNDGLGVPSAVMTFEPGDALNVSTWNILRSDELAARWIQVPQP